MPHSRKVPIDVTPEAEAAPEIESAAPAEGVGAESAAAEQEALIADLEAQLEAAQKQAEESKNQRLRTLAEFQNYKRRSDAQADEAKLFANVEVVKALFPIMDNFERALAAARSAQSFEALIKGVEQIEKQMQAFFEKHGVKEIEAVGQEFDPNFHEAVARGESEEHPENTVTEVFQKGYTLHDKVIRPSMVKVASG